MTFDVSEAGPGWLFRQSDLVLGPVTARQLVDKLYAGELGPETLVQQLGDGAFVRLGELPEFKVHVAKAQAKRRVDEHAALHHAEQRSRLVKVAVGAGVALGLVGVGVAALGQYFAVHGGVAGEPGSEITIDPPTISKARRSSDDELVEYRGGPRKPAARAEAAPAATARPAAAGAPGRARPEAADPDGLAVGEVDEAAINAVVAKNKPTLIHCIRDVATADMAATRIPIEFAISEVGKVTRVWVDHPDFKDGGLQDCLLKELARWSFKPGPTGASVNLSFNVGKRG